MTTLVDSDKGTGHTGLATWSSPKSSENNDLCKIRFQLLIVYAWISWDKEFAASSLIVAKSVFLVLMSVDILFCLVVKNQLD